MCRLSGTETHVTSRAQRRIAGKSRIGSLDRETRTRVDGRGLLLNRRPRTRFVPRSTRRCILLLFLRRANLRNRPLRTSSPRDLCFSRRRRRRRRFDFIFDVNSHLVRFHADSRVAFVFTLFAVSFDRRLCAVERWF